MTSQIVYKGDLRTTATHLRSNTTIITDAPTDNHGKGESFSPTDLVATALGSCMLTIMGIVSNRHDWDITGAQVSIQKIMGSNPRKIAAIEVTIDMPARQYTDQAKKTLENAAKTCPVALSLADSLVQKVVFNW